MEVFNFYCSKICWALDRLHYYGSRLYIGFSRFQQLCVTDLLLLLRASCITELGSNRTLYVTLLGMASRYAVRFDCELKLRKFSFELISRWVRRNKRTSVTKGKKKGKQYVVKNLKLQTKILPTRRCWISWTLFAKQHFCRIKLSWVL